MNQSNSIYVASIRTEQLKAILVWDSWVSTLTSDIDSLDPGLDSCWASPSFCSFMWVMHAVSVDGARRTAGAEQSDGRIGH